MALDPAAGAVPILAWASIAFLTASCSAFCATPYAAKSFLAKAAELALIAADASCNAAASCCCAVCVVPVPVVGGVELPPVFCAASPALAPELPPKTWSSAASSVGAKPIWSPKATKTSCNNGYDVSPVPRTKTGCT